jgi:hypothetical protein
LHGLCGLAGATLLGAARPSVLPAPAARKLVLVQFGGGVRSSETIDDPAHEHIPHLWKDLVPRGTLFCNMRVEHAVVHSNSTASIVTGHWEYADLDWTRPPVHASLFERHRKARGLTDTTAWTFVYASILAQTGESLAPGFGASWGANVVVPPTIPRTTGEQVDAWLAEAAATGSRGAERAALRRGIELVRSTSRFALGGLRSDAARDFIASENDGWLRSGGSISHDLYLAERAMACMRRFAPDVLAVCFGEIDCAHFGSWSRYLEAIRRTDELTARLWQTIQQLPSYRDRTLMLVLPDHGRELERPGGPGFIHHSDFYTGIGADEGCRRVWMLALGPGVAAGRRIARPLPITAVAATGLDYLGDDTSTIAEPSVLPELV